MEQKPITIFSLWVFVLLDINTTTILRLAALSVKSQGITSVVSSGASGGNQEEFRVISNVFIFIVDGVLFSSD